MNPDIFRSTLAHALTHTDRYAWVFPENVTFLKRAGDGGAEEAWVNAIRRAKEDADRAIRSSRK